HCRYPLPTQLLQKNGVDASSLKTVLPNMLNLISASAAGSNLGTGEASATGNDDGIAAAMAQRYPCRGT
ncbi:MAG: hypothetical protein AAF480_10290, partial [Actinomycetota bacterium]